MDHVNVRRDISSFDYEELAEEVKRMGEKPFRSRQIYEWLHVRLADSFEEMTNLSKSFRGKLAQTYQIPKMELVERQISKVDSTEKFLFELMDGNMIESVLMRHPYGNSVCLPRQAAGWAAVFVPQPSAVSKGIWPPRRF